MKTNKFYFSVKLSFKKDCNLDFIQKLIGLKPYKVTNLKDAKGPIRTAKIIFKTDEFEEIYTDQVFEKFILTFKDKFENFSKLLKEYDGTCWFTIVFTKINAKPCLSLSNEVLNVLAKLGANYDIDFT